MDKVMQFASKELAYYFEKMTGEQPKIRLIDKGNPNPFCEHFTLAVQEGEGEICGENPHSVLMGVYHFLRLCGCVFLRPERKGELIPKREKAALSATLDFTPSHRHRGITLEGCCSKEHVLSLIDWAAKNGFNSYFIQFRTGYTFFLRWHIHQDNPYLEEEPFDDEIAEGYNREIREVIALRGMYFHAVGHGWTCEPFGIPSRGWQDNLPMPEEYRDCFAQVNGKREFFKGVPLNTNLCYSNPRARKAVVEEIVRYARENPQVALLHVWLADYYNNFCECEECRKKTPSDWYVVLLNEIDEGLTAARLPTKIVFLIYYELLFTPKTERIRNEERFVMMFAPITRRYDKTWAGQIAAARTANVPTLTLNEFTPPPTTEENLVHLFEWQKHFKGDSFVFDYPLMWEGNVEYGGVQLAKTIHGDIRSLKELGLGGYVSCQVQRAFFPTGLCMYVMGHTLYDENRTFEDLANEYFQAAFGKNAKAAFAMAEEISAMPVYEYMKNRIPVDSPFMREESPKLAARLAEMQTEIAALRQTEESHFIQRNWRHLSLGVELVQRVVKIIEQKTTDNENEETMSALRKELQLWIFGLEPELDGYADCLFLFLHVQGMSMRK